MEASLGREASRLRVEIVRGAVDRDALLARLVAIPLRDRDVFADVLLGLEEAPPDDPALPRQSVPYLPCGVDEILTVVREAPIGPGDTFVDVGAGLGRVAMLVHLLTGARASGIEVQPALVRAARERAGALGLTQLSFVHADASATVLEGSVYFLYAPANGEALRRIVAHLEAAARERSIVVACVGFEIHDAPSLVRRATSHVAVTLYDAAGRERPAIATSRR